MKKQLKWLVAALALAALTTPAYAVTADMTGSLSVRGIATNNFDRTDDINDHGQFADQRFRLFTSAAANENVKAVLGLEVDSVWGRTAAGTAAAPTYGKQVGALGSDAKGELEIKHLYLDFNLPDLKTNIKAGTQAFNFGRGLIINDDAAGVQATIDLGGNPLNLYWIKSYEWETTTDSDEIDFYGVKYTLKTGDVAIAPYVGYTTYGEKVLGDEATSLYLGVDIDGKAEALTYGLTAIYNNWDAGDLGDGDSIALLAKADYTMGDTKLLVEAGRYGDKDAGGDFVSLQDPNVAATGPINNFSEILTGGLYTSNSAGVANVGGAANLYSANYLYAKLGAQQKLSDAAKISGYVMHVEQAEDTAAGDAITYGQEVDLYFDYAILPGLGLNLAGAYMLVDNDFGDDDAWKLASSLNYKF